MREGVDEDIVGQAGLPQAKGVAAAAQFQVSFGDQEAVVGAAQDVEPLLGRR